MTALEDMARRVRRGEAMVKQWALPVLGDFFHGRVMAFDQSLSATGVVVLVSDEEGVRVLWAGIVRTTTTEGLGGHEENLDRALDIRHRYTEVLNNHWIKDMSVVHEMVPVGGGRLNRPESSLLSALALRIAAEDLGCPLEPSVAPQRHRKAICGNAKAQKPEAHRALANLAALLPIGGYSLVTNEATRDALCVGLTHLLRGLDG